MVTLPYLIENAEVSIHAVKKSNIFISHSAGMIEKNICYPGLKFNIIFYLYRFSIVLGSTSACILRPSSLEWHQYTWLSFVSWAMKMRQGTTAIALRLGEMVGR
jgi:hypothetical protein